MYLMLIPFWVISTVSPDFALGLDTRDIHDTAMMGNLTEWTFGANGLLSCALVDRILHVASCCVLHRAVVCGAHVVGAASVCARSHR